MAKPEIIELARKAKKGDRTSFEELCHLKLRDMTFSALTKVGNIHDAEDVVQESALIMYRFIGRLKSPEAIDVWIEKIVRTRCADLLRKRAPLKTELDIDDETIDIPEENREFLPEKFAEDEALRGRLYELVTQLPEKAREAIILYYYEGLSYKEIAQVTGTTTKTVSTNLIYARNKLKKKLSDLDNTTEIADMSSMPAVAATSTVMGRALSAESLKYLPDERMAVIEQRVLESIHAQPFSAAKSAGQAAAVVKATLSIAAAVMLFFGAVFFAGGLRADTDGVSAETVAVTNPVTSEARSEIVFLGGDCECGHINPSSVKIANLSDADRQPIWQIFEAGSTAPLVTGGEAEAAAELAALTEKGQDGSYTITCSYTDGGQKEVKLKRSFVTGDYAGGDA
jgi:RNA polymerase sigma-70 factor (ECF subfamily)